MPPKTPQDAKSHTSQNSQERGSNAQSILNKLKGIVPEFLETNNLKWIRSVVGAMPICGHKILLSAPICGTMDLRGDDDESASCLTVGGPPVACVFKEKKDTFWAVVRATTSGKRLLDSKLREVKRIHGDFFLCALAINESTPKQQCAELEKIFSEAQREESLTVGQAFLKYQYSEVNENLIEGLPSYFSLDVVPIREVLKPLPSVLWKLKASTQAVAAEVAAKADKEIVSQYTPCVFTGASGSGKTVSALMLEVKTKMTIVGLYDVYGEDKPKGGEEFADYIAEKLVARCKMVESRNLKDTAFYIVMDEMGKCKAAAHFIIKKRTEDFTALIRKKLKDNDFEYFNHCEFHYSIVGTGVTGPAETGNSLPKGYNLVTPSTDTLDLFSNVLKQKVQELEGRERLYNAACKYPHLKALLSNRRCAYVMADSIGGLVSLHSFDSNDISDDDNNAKDFLQGHASFLEVNTTYKYVKLNGWGKKPDVQKRFYATWLLSLVFTQPHGYHLIVPEVATELAVTLGALDDALRVDTEKAGNAAKGRSHTHEFGYSPTDVQFTTSTATTVNMYSSEAANKTTQMRFVVPSASIIVALNVLTGTVGSATSTSASAYEVTIAAMVTAVLDAFTWFAAYHGKSEFTVPLHHMFPDTETYLRSAQIKLKVPGFIWDGATGNDKLEKFEGQCQQWQPVKVNDPQRKEGRLRVAEVITAVEKQKTERGAAIIIAGDGTPLSDITIVTPDLCIGVELKCYHKGGLVRVDTLSKRCYQTGFDALNLTTSYEEARFGSTDAKCIPSTVAEMFLYGAAPQSLPPDGEQNPTGTKEKEIVAAVLSSDPNTLKLQIQSISDETSRFGRLVHMALRAGQSSLQEFLILVSPTAHLLPTEGLVAATFRGPQIATKVDKKSTVWNVSDAPLSTYHNKDTSCRIFSVVVSAIGMSLRCSWKTEKDYQESKTLFSDASSVKQATSADNERVVEKRGQCEVKSADSMCFKVDDKWVVRAYRTMKATAASTPTVSN